MKELRKIEGKQGCTKESRDINTNMFVFNLITRSLFMHPSAESTLLSCLLLTLCFPFAAHAEGVVRGGTQSDPSRGSSFRAEHVLGLPGAKPKEDGTLRITATDFVFSGKTSSSTIPLQSIFAVSAGNERVELWGMKGRIMRAAIPDGGGLVAATFMHHRVDMLTVEFSDPHGAYHGAVFFLHGEDGDRALQTMSALPVAHREPADGVCEGRPVALRAVRVSTPVANEGEAPAAYRALVYERLVDGLNQEKGVDHVLRDGETGACPQYTLQLTFTGFKQGSQVGRASLGPVGMFVGTTQMMVEVNIIDAEGKVKSHDQIKATVRGESESVNVAGSVAKKLAKQFAAFQKESDRNVSGTTARTYSR
jgi:hypothetical protein